MKCQESWTKVHGVKRHVILEHCQKSQVSPYLNKECSGFLKSKRGAGWIIIILTLIVLILLVAGSIVYILFLKPSELVDAPSNMLCQISNDTYTLPDFARTKTILESQPMVKTVPADGIIALKFYHDSGNCRVFDKTYLLRDGKIEERNVKADIELIVPSDYAKKLREANLCEIVKEANNKGDLDTKINIDRTKLMWVYKSMLQYKDCLGL